MQRTNQKMVRAIFWTGLLAGTLDITAASVQYYLKGGRDLGKLLRYIASGVLGKEAFTGGTGTALFGLLLHYIIAYSFTIIFFLVYPRVRRIFRNKIVEGLLYGVFVWFIMNFIIVPISNTPKSPFNLTNSLIALAILMLMIGLPISLMANHFFRRTSATVSND